MTKLLPVAVVVTIFLYSCSKKHTPEKTTVTVIEPAPTIVDSVVVKKKAVRQPTKKDIIPNTIVVNDKAAHKAVDGRLYYDLLGHRYWKNYKDGKYYLFNQKMYDNPAFKPPK